MADLNEQLRVYEVKSSQMLTEFDRACQEKEALQAKLRDQIYRTQKQREETEERDEKIE